jgi:uncharacterized membrane protein YkoI
MHANVRVAEKEHQMKRKMLVTAAAAALSALAIGHAANAAENDALAIAGAKIDLAKAVAAAEQHVGGKASKGEYERHKGQWVYDIEVVKDKKVMDVKVDAGSGKVISATEDKADQDDDHDEAD